MSCLLFKLIPIDILRIIIQYLELNDINILDNIILNNNNRNIYLLSLNNIEIYNINKYTLNKKIINWLIKRKVLVRDINVHPVDKNLIDLIEINYNNIKSIKLSCQGVTDEIISHLNKCHNLISITLERCIGISDNGMQNFLKGQNKIENITIIGCLQLTNVTIQLIAESSRNLEYLNLDGFECLTDTDVFQIIKYCPNLKIIKLKITNITDRSIEALIEAYPNLDSLVIEDCRFTTLNGHFLILQSIATKMLFNDNNLELQKLNLHCFRIILIHPNYNRSSANQIVDMNLLTQFIYFLTRFDSEELLLDSLYILSNLTCLASQCIPNLVEGNIIHPLINLAKHQNEEISEISAHILGFIASYSLNYRDLIISLGALSSLTSNFRSTISAMEYAIFAISRLCSGDPFPLFRDIHVVVPFLLQIIFKPKHTLFTLNKNIECLNDLECIDTNSNKKDDEDIINRDTESEMNGYDIEEEDEDDEEIRVNTFHILNRIIFSISDTSDVTCLLNYNILNYISWLINKFGYIPLVHDMIQCFLQLYPPISSTIDKQFGSYIAEYYQRRSALMK